MPAEKLCLQVNVISERVDHADHIITYSIYSHLLPGMKREAVEQFERLLRESLPQS